MPHCHHEVIQNFSLISLFNAGLFGSISHCSTMCGPLVLAQTGARFQNTSAREMSELKRIQDASLIPYHLGRMTTYILLGVITYLAINIIAPNNIFKYIASILLLIAALMFLGAATGKYKIFNNISSPNISKIFITGKLGKLISYLSVNPRGLRGYLLGIFLGFLPCGLVYAAISVAATSNDIMGAVMGMTLFTLGTMPTLIVISYFGSWVFKKFENKIAYFTKFIMFLNSLMLAYMAYNIVL